MKRTTKNEAGMSLIELMFATGILAGTLSMVFTSLIGISVVGTTNEGRLRAATTVASVLEEVNALSFADTLKYAPPSDLSAPGVYHQVQVEMLLSSSSGDDEESPGTAVVTALPVATGFNTTSVPDPVEIRVTLTWQEQNGRIYQVNGSTIKGKVP